MAAKNTNTTAGKEFSLQKLVIGFMAAGIVIMFMTSFIGGGNVPDGRQKREAIQGQDAAMAEVPMLMAKLKENPRDTVALQELAEAFSRAQDWEKAAIFWGRVIEILPEDANALNHRGAALMRVNRYEEAAADYEKILGINENEYHALYYLGIIYKYGFQNQEKAREYFQRSLDKNPTEAELVKALREEMKS